MTQILAEMLPSSGLRSYNRYHTEDAHCWELYPPQ